ncbi:hypothetical protein MFLAVUS_004823 [Mucor flavus]|uniref:Uncharacterized protein n=1 Tax=Mucor flavus TaxID=439312 RepID=A0ABP9YWZ9_9FUNG
MTKRSDLFNTRLQPVVTPLLYSLDRQVTDSDSPETISNNLWFNDVIVFDW